MGYNHYGKVLSLAGLGGDLMFMCSAGSCQWVRGIVHFVAGIEPGKDPLPSVLPHLHHTPVCGAVYAAVGVCHQRVGSEPD
jgi:hypothetical protein